MHHKKTLRLATFSAVVVLLSGCAASMPKVAYTGPVVHNSPLANKTVALVTTTTGDQFNDPECLTALTSACRNTTLTSKTSITDYNNLLKQALTEEGATVVADPPADITIDTHMTAMEKHRYMFLLDYDLGHTVAMGLIPVVGLFTPKYYEVIGHMDDKITVHDSSGVVLKKTYSVAIKKDITGDEDQAFEHGQSSSKAVRLYLTAQTTAIQYLLTDTNHALGANG